MVIVALTGLKTRPGSVWNWAAGRRDDVAASPDAADPCPQVPGFLMNIEQIETLTREIGQNATEKADSFRGRRKLHQRPARGKDRHANRHDR